MYPSLSFPCTSIANAVASGAALYLDTFTVYIAGGTTPPPGVPSLYFRPYRFQTPGPKSVRIAAYDGCMQHNQTIALTALCRALTSQSSFVFPPSNATAGNSFALKWSPVNNTGAQTGYGRWYNGDLYSSNTSNIVIEGTYSNLLGFYASANGNYSDSITLLDGSVSTSTFDPTKSWNSLSVSPSVPSFPGVPTLRDIVPLPGGGNHCIAIPAINVSTASGVTGTTVPSFSSSRKTLAFGFSVQGDSFGVSSTFLSSDRLSGYIHTCPLRSSPSGSYILPTFSVAALTPTGYQQVIPSSSTMTINCTKLSEILFSVSDRFAIGSTGSAIAIGSTALRGAQRTGDSYISTYGGLPPSAGGYVLFVQSQSSEGTFELNKAFTFQSGKACKTFGWSDIAAQLVNVPSSSDISQPFALRPLFGVPVNYAVKVSDGCTNSSTSILLNTVCDAFSPAAYWTLTNV